MKLKKIHQTPPSTKTLYSLLPLKTRSLKFQKPTPLFCYVLPKATINHYRQKRWKNTPIFNKISSQGSHLSK